MMYQIINLNSLKLAKQTNIIFFYLLKLDLAGYQFTCEHLIIYGRQIWKQIIET